MTGHGGWPMTVFLDPEGVPFYGGTYFPPDESRGMPSFRMVMEAVVDAFERKREEIRERAAGDPRRGSARSARIEPSPSRPRRPRWTQAVAAPARRRRPRATAASAARPSSRPPRPWSCCSARGETEVVELTLDAMLAGGIYDQLGGGFARYSVDAGLARPPLREDALRQRPARPRLPARLAGARPRALPARLRGDAGLDAARDARPRGRLLLGPRRRLRGRGGPLLRLDAGADPRGARRGRGGDRIDPRSRLDAFYGRQRGAATSRAPTSSTWPAAPRRAAEPPRASPRRAQALLRGARQAGLAGARRQAPDRLERAGDRRPGRGRRRARPRRLPRRRPRAAPSSCSTRCATTTAACCAPTRTATPASTPTSRTTPSCSRRC